MVLLSEHIGEEGRSAVSITLHYVLDFSVLLCIYLIIYFRSLKSRDLWQRIMCHLAFLYASLLLFFTLMPFQLPIPRLRCLPVRYNLIPFQDISLGHLGARREALLNVLLFMPMGFFLPELRKKKFFPCLLACFLASLSVETLQLLCSLSGCPYTRAFDVTDLITNTLGGVLGYGVWLLLRPVTGCIRRRIE